MNVQSSVRVPFLDLDLLQTLVAIAETGSFSSAGAVVGRTPSAISMQVRKMEDLIGRAVFVRDSRSVALTGDGEVLLEHARRMLALNRQVVAQFVQPDLRGVVRMGAPDDAAERFLPDMLRRFAETHPCVTVDVTVDGSSRMIAMHREGRLDVTLVTCEAGFDDGEAEIVYREQLVWAVCAGGVAVERDPLPVSVWEEGCVWRKAGIDGLDRQGRAWREAFKSAHISGQRAAILADLAVAPIPVSCLGGRIVEAPARHGLPPLPQYALGMLVAKDAPVPVKAAADHLRASFARR